MTAFWFGLLGALALASTIIILVVALLENRIASAAWRRALWQIALILLLAVPASEFSGAGRGTAAFLFGKKKPLAEWRVAPPVLPETVQPMTVTISAAPAIVLPVEYHAPRTVWWPGLIWLAGAAIVLTRVFFSQALCLALRFKRSEDVPLTKRVSEIAAQLGIRRDVRLVSASGLLTPIAFGIARPAIGLPDGFITRYNAAQRDAMLAHELAHLANRDPLWRVVAGVAAAIFWWQPMVWWARRRFHAACELAADEASAVVENGPCALAECLVSLGRDITGARRWAWIGVDGSGFKSNLGRRVERLLWLSADAKSRPVKSAAWPKTLLAACLVALAIILSGWAEAQSTVKPSTWTESIKQSWASSPGALMLMAAASKDETSAQTISTDTGHPVLAEAVGAPAGTNHVSKADAQAIFKGKCADCHLTPSRGLTGATLYDKLCGVCHEASPEHRAGKIPNLREPNKPTDFDFWKNVITNGKTNTSMPAFSTGRGGPLTDSQINSLADFLANSISHTSTQPGAKPDQKNPARTGQSVQDFLTRMASIPDSTNGSTPLFTKTYQVDPNTFVSRLQMVVYTPVPAATFTNLIFEDVGGRVSATLTLHSLLRDFFQQEGVDLTLPGKSVFFSDRHGLIQVRASARDQEIIEKAISSLICPPAQLELQTIFYEMNHKDAREFSAMVEHLPAPNADKIREATARVVAHIVSDSDGARTNVSVETTPHPIPNSRFAVFTREQYRLVCDYLDKQKGIIKIGAQKVTSLSGRQIHVGIEDGLSEPIGASLDAIPTVMGDRKTIEIVAIPKIVTRLADKAGKASYETNTIICSATTTDQRAVMLGDMSVHDAEYGKEYIVIIRPTLVDPAGNAIHTEEELSAPTSAP